MEKASLGKILYRDELGILIINYVSWKNLKDSNAKGCTCGDITSFTSLASSSRKALRNLPQKNLQDNCSRGSFNGDVLWFSASRLEGGWAWERGVVVSRGGGHTLYLGKEIVCEKLSPPLSLEKSGRFGRERKGRKRGKRRGERNRWLFRKCAPHFTIRRRKRKENKRLSAQGQRLSAAIPNSPRCFSKSADLRDGLRGFAKKSHGREDVPVMATSVAAGLWKLPEVFTTRKSRQLVLRAPRREGRDTIRRLP